MSRPFFWRDCRFAIFRTAALETPLRALFVGNTYIYTHALSIAVSLVAESRDAMNRA